MRLPRRDTSGECKNPLRCRRISQCALSLGGVTSLRRLQRRQAHRIFAAQVRDQRQPGQKPITGSVDTLIERSIAWLLRSISTAILFAGGALLVAGLPLFALMPGDSPLLQTIGSTLLQLGGLLTVSAGAARYLLGPRGPMPPNEQVTIEEARRPKVAGWLLALAVTLIAGPLLLAFRLQPFLAEWGRVVALIRASDFSGDMGMSGLVLMPIAGALTPPFIELMTLAAMMATSVILLVALLLRSHRFPRFYVVCLALLTGLVIASLRGVSTVNVIAETLRQFIESTSVNAAEAAALRVGLDRYTTVVGPAAAPLVAAWLAYALWLPLLFSSARVRETFARPIPKPVRTLEKTRDVETITAPPRFPGVFY